MLERSERKASVRQPVAYETSYEAIVLIDPDFLFLTQFQFPGGTPPVFPGKPAAAKYGLGGQVSNASLLMAVAKCIPLNGILFTTLSRKSLPVLGLQLDANMRSGARFGDDVEWTAEIVPLCYHYEQRRESVLFCWASLRDTYPGRAGPVEEVAGPRPAHIRFLSSALCGDVW